MSSLASGWDAKLTKDALLDWDWSDKRLVWASNVKPGTVAHLECGCCVRCLSHTGGTKAMRVSVIDPCRLGPLCRRHLLGNTHQVFGDQRVMPIDDFTALMNERWHEAVA